MSDEQDQNILERGKRLSESMLWDLMREYYTDSGIDAWNSGSVPFYITNTPALASAWAGVVLGFLRDLKDHDLLDQQAPLYIVEIGAGSGRHAYLLLRALEELGNSPLLHRQPWTLVLADLAQSNLDFYRSHSRFEKYLDAGLLDLACFDAERDQQIKLQHSDRVITSESLKNPLIVVTNYLLDSLTQDAFRMQSGQLHEAFPVLSLKEGADADQKPLLPHLKIRYEAEAVDTEYYENEIWNAILSDYRETLGDTAFSFPVGALNLIANLLELSNTRMLLLSADKSWNRLEELSNLEDPEPILHGGGFSLTVNSHAIECYLARRGGRALHTTIRESVLEASAFVIEPKLSAFPETGLAFEQWVEDFGPIDYFSLKEQIQKWSGRPSLRLTLDLLRLSRYDPQTLYDFSDPMLKQVEEADPDTVRELRTALARIWDNFYPIGDETDVPFEIARLYYRMEHYATAIIFYELSLEYYGHHKMTVHNIGLCHYYMRDLEQARSVFEEALELDPDYGPAREWKLKVESELRELRGLHRPIHASGEMPAVQLPEAKLAQI